MFIKYPPNLYKDYRRIIIYYAVFLSTVPHVALKKKLQVSRKTQKLYEIQIAKLTTQYLLTRRNYFDTREKHFHVFVIKSCVGVKTILEKVVFKNKCLQDDVTRENWIVNLSNPNQIKYKHFHISVFTHVFNNSVLWNWEFLTTHSDQMSDKKGTFSKIYDTSYIKGLFTCFYGHSEMQSL